jgi:hypothetical protein
MKRNIIINEQRSAIAITDNLVSGVKLIASDCKPGNEVFVFDTELHICYAYKVVRNGFTMIEEQVPVMQFRNFKTIGIASEIYAAIIASIH